MNEVREVRADANVKIAGIVLKSAMDDYNPYKIFEENYGRITEHRETNAIKIGGEDYFVPNEKWCHLHGKDRKEAYIHAVNDAKRAEQFQDGQFGYIGLIALAKLEIRISGEKMPADIAESLWGIESDSNEIGWILRELLSELRSRLSNMGFSITELDAAFEKYAKLQDKDLQWTII